MKYHILLPFPHFVCLIVSVTILSSCLEKEVSKKNIYETENIVTKDAEQPSLEPNTEALSQPDPNTMSDETDRIYQIKQMYEYVKTLNVIKVKRGRAITNPGGSIVEGEDEGENLHSAKIMFYEEGYKVYSASFDQYEGNEGLLIYYNNDDMFFCVYSNSAEGDTEQYRLYFDKYTNVIKMTYKEKNSDSSERGPYDIIDSRKVQEIRRIVLDFKRKIEIMCI